MVLLIVTLLLMVVGFVGIIVPGLPGIGLIFISALCYGYFTNFDIINGWLLFVFAGMTTLALVFDYIGGILGAKKYGATKAGIMWGMIGGMIGLVVFGFLGLIIGQLIGTIGGELLKGKELNTSIKSGFGTLLGYILGVSINMSIGLIMILLFVVRVL